MLIRYIGRESHFRGKTLYEIACNLKNFGEGRVVTRVAFLNRYTEKSYYRLTKVKPDLTDTNMRLGQAWGLKIFRGTDLGERQIDSGMKMDWRLIPKEEEEEFCKLTEKDVREERTVPLEAKLPPLLAVLIKQNMKKTGQEVTEPLSLKLKIEQSFTNRAKQC